MSGIDQMVIDTLHPLLHGLEPHLCIGSRQASFGVVVHHPLNRPRQEFECRREPLRLQGGHCEASPDRQNAAERYRQAQDHETFSPEKDTQDNLGVNQRVRNRVKPNFIGDNLVTKVPSMQGPCWPDVCMQITSLWSP